MINEIKNLTKNLKKEVSIFVILVILSSWISTFLPAISGNFIDFIVNPTYKGSIYSICGIFTILTIMGIIFGYLVNLIYVKVYTETVYEYTKKIIKHVQKMKMSYINNVDSSFMSQQINIDISCVIDFYFKFVQDVISNGLKIIMSIVFIGRVDIFFLFLILVVISLYGAFYIFFKERVYQASLSAKNNQSFYFSKIYEQLEKVKFIKIHSLYNWINERMKDPFNRLLKSLLTLQRVQYVYVGFDSILMSLSQIVIFITGGTMVINKNITIGELTILSSYYSIAIGTIRYFFDVGKRYQDVKVSFDRIEKIMNEPEEKNGCIQLGSIEKIEILDLSFEYDSKKILSNFTYSFEKNSSYAISGKNGVGKTTLIMLLLGLLEPQSGTIRINGEKYIEIDMISLRKNLISVVEQNSTLLNDSIEYNLNIGNNFKNKKMDKDIEKIGLIFEEINIKEVLEGEINYNIDNVSGGEKQKICLIRGLLKKADLYIMDEPTSFLDISNRNIISKTIKELSKNSIVIVVTHDTEIANTCDYIIKL